MKAKIKKIDWLRQKYVAELAAGGMRTVSIAWIIPKGEKADSFGF